MLLKCVHRLPLETKRNVVGAQSVCEPLGEALGRSRLGRV